MHAELRQQNYIKAFFAIRLLEFIAGGLALAFLHLSMDMQPPWCLYDIKLLPDFTTKIMNNDHCSFAAAFHRYWPNALESGFFQALMYESMLFYFPFTIMVWATLALIGKQRWIPLSVPVAYLAHSIVFCSLLKEEVIRSGAIYWFLAIIFMIFVDFFLGKLAEEAKT